MRRVYTWTRDLHLYLGLFVCPFVLVFAVSTISLNHPGWFRPELASESAARETGIAVAVPDGLGTLEQAREILRQLNVTGEIDYVRHSGREPRLQIPVTKPGERIQVEADLRAKTAVVERRRQNLSDALRYLHKMPGPHNAKVRGNWIYMAWWRLLADATVYGVLFLAASGLYLWWILKAERKIGWALLGAGFLSATLLVAAIVTA